jgi:release factor glutamine methyltransferase
VESPRLQAELLLAHLLKMPRMKLYLNFERALSTAETDSFREMIKRRGQREPLQHITGSVSFCGFEIAVNRQALVPRPETEILAELGWTFLSTLNSATALDVGTGTGCIAIALAAKCPQATISASDISAEALTLARQNAEKNQVRIEFFQGDGFAALPPAARFDLIISNPPYIATAEIETLQPEVRDFDPRAALEGGADGLEFYRRFASQAKSFLKPGGKIMLEFGDGQAPAIRNLFEKEKWIVEAVKDDYSQRARILIASWKVS